MIGNKKTIHGKNSPIMRDTSVFFKQLFATAQSKQSPIERIFAQYGTDVMIL
jgi:hypothetical protein